MPGVLTESGGDDADRHDRVRLGDDHVGGQRDDRIEVVRGQRIFEIAVVVGLLRRDQGEIAADRGLEQEWLAVDLDDPLALLDHRPDAGRGEHAPKPTPPARMRSISVPCGTRSTSISPAIILAWVSGLRPMCEATSLATAPALISLPIPRRARRCRWR